jgi:hypothetical protein
MLLKAIVWEDRGQIQPKGGGESYSLRTACASNAEWARSANTRR